MTLFFALFPAGVLLFVGTSLYCFHHAQHNKVRANTYATLSWLLALAANALTLCFCRAL